MQGKNGAHVHVDVDVGGAVQRIENQNVIAPGEFRPHADQLGLLFGSHGADGPAAFHAVDKNTVGNGVHFLDVFSLHIDFSGAAENIQQTGLIDAAGNGLAGQDQVIQQAGEHTGSLRGHLLMQQQMFGNRNVCHEELPVKRENSPDLRLFRGPSYAEKGERSSCFFRLIYTIVFPRAPEGRRRPLHKECINTATAWPAAAAGARGPGLSVK